MILAQFERKRNFYELGLTQANLAFGQALRMYDPKFNSSVTVNINLDTIEVNKA